MDKELIEIAEYLGQTLRARALKLAIAESCTGGGICQLLTSCAGSSHWFERGFITYSNNSKIQMLGVSPQILNLHGAVSRQIALDMALGALNNSEADYTVSVTGIAGPDGGSIEKPVGTVFIALQNGTQSFCYEKHFMGTRHEIRQQSIMFALKMLLEFIST